MQLINPFQDKQGGIQFPFQPILDRVFILPSPPPEKFQGSSLIEIPQQYQEFYTEGIGILLAVGPGYFTQKGKWVSPPDQLKVGCKVAYDVTVPWRHYVKDADGEFQEVILCGASDIYIILED